MITQKSFLNNCACLYLVATPIGNLADITYRAVDVLKSVDVCFAEDTRVTRVLFAHYNISTQLECYQEFNKESEAQVILHYLSAGKNVALVSDAGMPIISDPGFHVAKLAIEAGYNVIPIPGASASLSALVASGISAPAFAFYGFLDSKSSKRKAKLASLKCQQETLIFYEAPHRIKEMLKDMLETFGDRKIVLAREITKKFEEFLRGNISEVLAVCDALKGEMVIICEGAKELDDSYQGVDLITQVDDLILAGKVKNEAIKLVAKRMGMSKQELYKEYLNRKKIDNNDEALS